MKLNKIFFIFITIFIITINTGHSKNLTEKDIKRIAKKYNNNIVVLFWASYCNYCKKELKLLIENKNKLQKLNTRIILASIDGSKKLPKEIQTKIENNFISYTAKDSLINKLNVKFVPMIAIFDNKGNLHDIAPGFKTLEEILEMIK